MSAAPVAADVAPQTDPRSPTQPTFFGSPIGSTGGPADHFVQRGDDWFRYDLNGEQTLSAARYESVHGGFDVTLANEDPNRLVPLDTARALVGEGRIGRLHESFYTTTGNGTPVVTATRFGREIAGELREAGVGAVLLSGT